MKRRQSNNRESYHNVSVRRVERLRITGRTPERSPAEITGRTPERSAAIKNSDVKITEFK